jgi:ABC-2 type transport system ATP-binding protein
MPVIDVQHLEKRYGDRTAVADVSFAVQEGEVFGILGPNGAGKTTTVELIAGLRERDGGTLDVLGMDPGAEPRELREQLGIQLQESALPPKVRVGEALDLYASFYRDPADPAELSRSLGLDAVAGSRFGKLSGGQKQRVSIALALIAQPRIAILDELTTGLDPRARRDTWALIEQVRDRGVTILLVSHLMEEVERLCDRVAVIADGRVVAVDAPSALGSGTGGPAQTLRFRPSGPFEAHVLTSLPSVLDVREDGDDVLVDGTEDALGEVVAALQREGVSAERLRVQRRSMEDAYLDITTPEETH